MEQKEIKKPWCAYGLTHHSRFGKVEEERGDILGIRRTEGQLYEFLGIEEKYVKRFDTLEEAVELVSKSIEQPVKKLMQIASEDFPSYFQNKSKNN